MTFDEWLKTECMASLQPTEHYERRQMRAAWNKGQKHAMDVAFGRGDLMPIAAFRYCLGRSSYIVSDCVEWLRQVWPLIGENARNVIRRDLLAEISRDDEDRANGREHKALGHDCDRSAWLQLLYFIEGQRS